MQTDILIETLDTHTAGEPTRIVTGGIDRSNLRGETVAEKRDQFETNYDWLRRLLMCEPRGHDDMFGAVPVEATREDADFGLFFMDSLGYLEMCGHGTIGVVTALIETGQLEAAPMITVETPAGLVETRPTVVDGCVERVAITNVDSFVYDRVSVPVTLDDGHETSIPVDLVFAGNVFGLIDSDALELAIETANAEAFLEYGLEIRDAINDTYDISHPYTGETTAVSIIEFYEHSDGTKADRNIVVFGNGQVDRSPCGTGTCAKMTLLYDAGKLDLEEPYEYESVIGTRFRGRLLAAETRDGTTVTTPEISGSAHLTGRHTFFKHEADDLDGFSLSDGRAHHTPSSSRSSGS